MEANKGRGVGPRPRHVRLLCYACSTAGTCVPLVILGLALLQNRGSGPDECTVRLHAARQIVGVHLVEIKRLRVHLQPSSTPLPPQKAGTNKPESLARNDTCCTPEARN